MDKKIPKPPVLESTRPQPVKRPNPGPINQVTRHIYPADYDEALALFKSRNLSTEQWRALPTAVKQYEAANAIANDPKAWVLLGEMKACLAVMPALPNPFGSA